MRVTVVGSGTLLPDDRHRSPGHLVEWDRGRLLLDCGSGVVHGLARDGVDWREVSHVALSHFHTDHVGDLPALLWAWKHGVAPERQRSRFLLGPAGLHRLLEALATAHGEFVLEPGAPLRVVEVGASDLWEDSESGVIVRTHPARHTPEAVALRIEAAGRSIGYTGDTGPLPALGAFFRGVDLLISECAVADGAPTDLHLSPADVAELAGSAAPRVLVLTHRYPEVDSGGLEERVRACGFVGAVHVGQDGLRVEI